MLGGLIPKMWDECLYIKLVEDGKKPSDSWGGWPIDSSHTNVYTHKEITESDWNYWGIVDNGNDDLLAVDLDLYKMTKEQREEISPGEKWFGLLEMTTIVRTPAVNKDIPGLHVYLRYDGDEIPEAINNVDIKGSVGKGYTVSPKAPGYEIANDKEPVEVDLETLKALPVFLERTKTKNTGNYDSGVPYLDYLPKDGQFPIRWQFDLIGSSPPCIRKAVKNYEDDPKQIQLILKYFEAWGYDNDLISELHEVNPKITREAVRKSGLGKPSVYAILDRASFPENERVEHPSFLHSSRSNSGMNFMVDEGAETWRCWRHDITGNAYHLIGIAENIIECGDWEYDTLPWKKIMKAAEAYGIDSDFQANCYEIKDIGLCPADCGQYPSPIPRGKD